MSLKKRLKQVLSIVIIIGSFAFLFYYWRSHPEIVDQLRNVSPLTAVTLMALYLAMLLLLVLVYDTILRMCSKPIPLGEHTLLTFYSSIINFFGPLQSGPGFRTVYLKQRHGVSMKAYLTGTLVYYALFGFINLLFLASGALPLIFAPLLLAVLAAAVYGARFVIPHIRLLSRFHEVARGPLLPRLALLTFLQAALAALIYAIELQSIGVSFSPLEAFAYAGAGSLALFVSLTPGALGFRESFQFFSQSVHHVDSTSIVAANVLDRSVYVVLLGLLFLFIVGFHAKRKLQDGIVNTRKGAK